MAHTGGPERVETGEQRQAGVHMRHAGDSKAFIAVAAVLMAGIVIATMLAINAKLQSALSPTEQQAGVPAIKVVPSAGAPVLQNKTAPSIAKSPSNSQANAGANSP